MMQVLHRWLVYAELIFAVIPATLFLIFSFFLLFQGALEGMGISWNSVVMWLLWLGGVVGGYSLWLAFSVLDEVSIIRKTRDLIVLTGIVGFTANMFPFVFISLQSNNADIFENVVLYSPCLVWLHWLTLLFQKDANPMPQSSSSVTHNLS